MSVQNNSIVGSDSSEIPLSSSTRIQHIYDTREKMSEWMRDIGDKFDILTTDLGSPPFSRRFPLLPVTFYIYGMEDVIPPLTLLKNPNSLSFAVPMKMDVRDSNFSYIPTQWGRPTPSLSVSGVVGGFYTHKYGLSRFYAKNSAAYKNFMSLLLLYKNNGASYSRYYNKRRIATLTHIVISYDGNLFKGYFESFNYSESASSPFTFEYDFSFKIRENDNCNGSLGRGVVSPEKGGHFIKGLKKWPPYSIDQSYEPNFGQAINTNYLTAGEGSADINMGSKYSKKNIFLNEESGLVDSSIKKTVATSGGYYI